MDPNVSLQLSKRADETLWGRAISGIGRVVYSSTFNIYILLIATKRSSVLKAFHNYININDFKDESKRDNISEKYKRAYANYIATLEKYIVEHIYTKMQKNAATIDEQHIMANYYEVCKYKNEDQVLYRTKLEKTVLNMDWNTVQSAKSDAYVDRYKEFYLYNIEELYKAEMRHDAILLSNAKEGDRDPYEAVYTLVENYIKEVLPIVPEKAETNSILKDYRKYVATLDSYEKKDFLELRKRLTLLGFSKDLFEYSLPMIAKEQCYKEILEIARVITTNYYNDAEKYASYEVILDSIEEYVDNILDYKTYWDNEEEKAEYLKFREKFNILKKLARIDFDNYKKQREILFINYDLKFMNKAKIKLPELRDYYKERLIILHAIRCLKSKPKVSAGIWRPKRAFEADNITPGLLAKDNSPIDEIIASVHQLVHSQYTEFIKNNEMHNVSANIENTNEVEAAEESSFIDTGVRLISFAKNLITGGKKFKKRKAL